VLHRSNHLHELQKVMGTRKLADSSTAIDLKSLIELAACAAGTSDRRYWCDDSHGRTPDL